MAFLRDRAYVPGLSLSSQQNEETILSEQQIAAVDWLPGTVHGIYGSTDAVDIARSEHIARAHEIHPGIARAGLPLQRFELKRPTKTPRQPSAVMASEL